MQKKFPKEKKLNKKSKSSTTSVGALSPTGVGGRLAKKGGGEVFKVRKKN